MLGEGETIAVLPGESPPPAATAPARMIYFTSDVRPGCASAATWLSQKELLHRPPGRPPAARRGDLTTRPRTAASSGSCGLELLADHPRAHGPGPTDMAAFGRSSPPYRWTERPAADYDRRMDTPLAPEQGVEADNVRRELATSTAEMKSGLQSASWPASLFGRDVRESSSGAGEVATSGRYGVMLGAAIGVGPAVGRPIGPSTRNQKGRPTSQRR